MSEISRRSGIPVETVRYLYKTHILKRRMRVMRELDHQRLGLEHIQFIVTADPDLEPLFYNKALLSGVWEEIYAKTVYRLVPENQFFLDHLAPPALHRKLRDFYRSLEDLGAVKVHETYDASKLVHTRMWVEDYDWDLPGWDFDWSRASLRPTERVASQPASEPARFDSKDLLIIRELQKSYDQRIAQVGANASLTRSSAFWHYREHVEPRRFFSKYYVNWLGTSRAVKSERIPQTRQAYAAINFIAKGLSQPEMMAVRAQLHSIPYLWSEEVGVADFNAETFVWVRDLMEAFEFFGRLLRPLGKRARIFMADQSASVNYTIHPELYDEESRKWTYRGDLVLEGIKRALSGGALRSAWKREKQERAGPSPA